MENETNSPQKNTITQKIFSFFKSRNPINYFVAIIVFSIIVFAIFTLFRGFDHLRTMFFFNANDNYMDFFNSVRDVSQGTGVYTERHVIYPPMANLIFLIFEKLTPHKYSNTDFDSRYTWTHYPACIALIIIFLVIISIIYLAVFTKEAKQFGKKGIIIALLLVFNLPFIYSIERGNIVLLSITFTSFFLFNYDSENKVIKELALISLAFAFSLKLYPAILGWVLVTNKQWKEILRLCIYALLMLLIPSFFFGGPICIYWMIQNIIKFSQGKSSYDSVTIDNVNKLGFSESILIISQHFTTIIAIIGIIIFLVCSFYIKQKWKLILFACAVFFAIPAVSSIYGWIIFFAPLILFFKTEKLKGINWAYFLLMAIPFAFIPEIIKLDFLQSMPSYNAMVSKLAQYLLLVLLCLDGIITTISTIKNNKIQNV